MKSEREKMSYLSHSKDFQGVADAFMRDPKLYAPLLQFIENVMTRDSVLTKAEREIIAAYVSHLNGCDFCLGSHRSTLRSMKVDEKIIQHLEAGPHSVAIDDRLRALLAFAGKLTQTPKDVNEIDIETLSAAGWTDQAIEDAINVVALFAYVNRLVDGIGIRGNQAYFDYVGEILATQGYAPLIRMALKKAS